MVWRDPSSGWAHYPILLIDDNEFSRHTLARILEGHGHHVLQATSGAEGMIRLLGVPRPALVVLDLPLWRLDAWQIMEACEGEPLWAGVPIIVVSAADSLPGLPPSVVAQFEKPLVVRDLLTEIRRNLAVQA
jgi:two-component system sensor histidine kinase/response regulator